MVGVVAALTLPTVINNYQERMMVVKLKKVYAVLQNAFNLAIAENGTVNEWSDGTTYNEHTEALNNVMKNYFDYVKYCEKGDKTCSHFIYSTYKSYRSDIFTYWENPTFILKDGVTVRIKAENANGIRDWCKQPMRDNLSSNSHYYYKCGTVSIDLNGEKGPNRDGYDFFKFTIYQEVLVPSGRKVDHSQDNFSKCKADNYYFGLCTAWALQNENLDYLHCPDDLDWNGKHSCKD